MLYIGSETKERIRETAAGKYPSVASGFIFGTEDSQGNRTVTDVMTIEETDSLISSAKGMHLDKANAYAKLHGLTLLGIFQTVTGGSVSSDSLNVSDTRKEFSYLLLSIEDSNIGSIRSFRSNASGAVEEELISDKPIA